MVIKVKYAHPAWALAHKKPETELRFINNRYYLYAYHTEYDSVKKRPRKVSGLLSGTITQMEGFVPSPKGQLEKGLPDRLLFCYSGKKDQKDFISDCASIKTTKARMFRLNKKKDFFVLPSLFIK